MDVRLAGVILAVLLLLSIVQFAHTYAEETPGPSLPSTAIGGFKRLLIYYGWLNTSNIEDLYIDVIVVAGSDRILPGGDDYSIISSLVSRGTLVFAYLTDDNNDPVGMGSSFKTMVVDNTTGTLEQRVNYWLSRLKSYINKYQNVVTGVFLDECDPAYFTDDLSDPMVDYFSNGIREAVDYAHSLNLMVMVNGVMGYAGYGDYYLWEDFVSYYDPATGEYRLVEDFLQETSYDSPLQWINGLSRYKYLQDNGLLTRTFAVTVYDPGNQMTYHWVYGGHALARIMGVAGWGYADGIYYAKGNPVRRLPVYEYGPAIVNATIDSLEGRATGAFLAAIATFYESNGSAKIQYLYPTIIHVLDGDPSEYIWPRPENPVQGSSSSIVDLGLEYTTSGLFAYVKASFQDTPNGPVLHLYIDSDGPDAGSGYQVSTPNGTIGADYLIEVYSDGTAYLYNYTGSGTDWSWAPWKLVESSYDYYPSTNTLIVELNTPVPGFSRGASSAAVTTVVSYIDDAIAGYYTFNNIMLETPTFYEDSMRIADSAGLILGYEKTAQDTIHVYVTGPSGRPFNYTFLTPFESVSSVILNGEPIQYTTRRSAYGTIVSAIATPMSQADNVVEVQGVPIPIPEPGLLVALTIIVIILILVQKTNKKS